MTMMRQTPFVARLTAYILVVIMALGSFPVAALAAPSPTPTPAPTWNDTYDAEKPLNLKDSHLQGASCLLMDRATGRILYDKNGTKPMYPASTTKIMTLLLALEYGHLNEIITIPDEARDVPSDSSRTPVTPGEQMPFIDLLYGMMILSGNDAANSVAVIVGGSVPNFVGMMNERAKELGCTNTQFANAHGYHSKDHFSTAKDMALITKEGMRHDTFRAIVSALSYTMSATSEREKLRMATRNSMFVSSSKFYYEPMVGVKTGFHSKAGQCFVGAATKNGVNLISVTFKTTNDGRWMDSKRLMEYGFNQYKTYAFEELYNANPFYVSIENAAQDDDGKGMLALSAAPGGSIFNYTISRLPDEYSQTLEDYKANMTLEYRSELKAPIRQGDIIGEVKVPTADGKELTATLVASRDVAVFVEKSTIEKLLPWLSISPVKLFLMLIVLGLVTLIAVRIRAVGARNRKRREMYKRRVQAYEKYKSYR